VGTHKLLGELLVNAGIITVKTLERAIERQHGSGRRLGEVLEEMGVVTEEEMVDAMAAQLSMRVVKQIRGHQFPPELLALVPAEQAMKHSIFPLRARDGELALAVADPYAIDVTDLLAQKTGLRIMPILATPHEIQAAVQEYYLTADLALKKSETTRILVVDDSPVIANVLKAALEKEGFEVIQAVDGLEGVKVALNSKPHVILCDAIMPRMDGFGLRRALAAQPETASIPIILLTSKAAPEEEEKALAAGFFDFIAKPVNAVRIVSRIRRALEMNPRHV
jgi:CheY-like chemotaxis protein